MSRRRARRSKPPKRRVRVKWERLVVAVLATIAVVLAYEFLTTTTVRPAAPDALLEYRPREPRPEDIFQGQRLRLEATAYTAGPESTGKSLGDPEYGITASGSRVREWHTAAAGPSLPFGTRLFVPEFADKPNGGWFVVEDRGSAISDHHVDIYMPDLQDALRFGRQTLTVYIVTP